MMRAKRALSAVRHRRTRKEEKDADGGKTRAIGHSRDGRPSENKQPIAERDVIAIRWPNPTKRRQDTVKDNSKVRFTSVSQLYVLSFGL